MRNTAIPSMLKALEHNLNRNEPSPRLVEVGRLYRKTEDSYAEPSVLTLGAAGAARPVALGEPSKPLDFFDIKADVTALVKPFDFEALAFDPQGAPSLLRTGPIRPGHGRRPPAGILGRTGSGPGGGAKNSRTPLCGRSCSWGACKRWDCADATTVLCLACPRWIGIFPCLYPRESVSPRFAPRIGQQAHLVKLEPAELFRGSQVPGRTLRLAAQSQLAEADGKPHRRAGSMSTQARSSPAFQKKLGVEQRA